LSSIRPHDTVSAEIERPGIFPEKDVMLSNHPPFLPSFNEVTYDTSWLERRQTGTFMLAGDIGGTNSNFGLIEVIQHRPFLRASFHVKSKLVQDYQEVTLFLLEHIKSTYGMIITRACWGAAGVLFPERLQVKPTNLSVTIDAHKVRENSSLEELILINDFEAVGLGLDCISPSSIIPINTGKPRPSAQQACIGAGTGLGKTALLWNRHLHRYLPIASEGGHADCAAQNEQESALFTFIQKTRNYGCPISWEDVLSGYGISDIYQFLGTINAYPATPLSIEIQATGFQPDLISHYAQKDQRCYDAFVMYIKLYARCAKNFALDVLSLNGIFIAGGIAAKNIPLFQTGHFMQEFTKCGKQSGLLQDIPLSIIADYNISLYGAAQYLILHDQGIV